MDAPHIGDTADDTGIGRPCRRVIDLIELNADDFRRDPLAVRRATLASLVADPAPGLRVNEHLDHDDGRLVFEHACRLGLEGIVSKRRDSPYRSERSRDWIKSKTPNAPAAKREAAEDWGNDHPQARDIPAGNNGPHSRQWLPLSCGSGRCHHGATMNGDWLPDEALVRSLCGRIVCT